MPLTIRSATAADQAMIRRLIQEANLNRMSLDWPNFLIAGEDDAVVGIGQVKAHGDGTRELASLAVIPSRQGEGIGGTLIRALLAREPGVVYLTCRSQLQAYYERFGFTRLEPAEFPAYFKRMIPIANFVARFIGIKILVMRREAASPSSR